MSKAYETSLTVVSYYNSKSTTSIVQYTPVRLLKTTEEQIAYVTTKGQNAQGIAQETIPPLTYGKVALVNCGGVSRVRMASTAYTTLYLATTATFIGCTAGSAATGGGRCNRITTTTLSVFGRPLNRWAASDIISVALFHCTKSKL